MRTKFEQMLDDWSRWSDISALERCNLCACWIAENHIEYVETVCRALEDSFEGTHLNMARFVGAGHGGDTTELARSYCALIDAAVLAYVKDRAERIFRMRDEWTRDWPDTNKELYRLDSAERAREINRELGA